MGLMDFECPKKTLVLFFVVGASKSMEGSKIAAVNAAIAELIPALEEMSDTNPDAQFEIAALEFSSGARWITDGPVPVENFRWNNLKAAGAADFGAACKALNEKLSRKAGGFLHKAAGCYCPYLFLYFDGEPGDDWQGGLALLKKNNWFRHAVKIAIAVGDEANRDVLKEFTGTPEAVLETFTPSMLRKWIKFIDPTAYLYDGPADAHGSDSADDVW